MEMEIDTPKSESQIKEDDLFKAVEKGNTSIFKTLSEQDLHRVLSLRNEDDRSLLHVAASSGHTEVVKVLSAADSSISVINSTDEEGWTPLHSASSIGKAEIVEILVSRGADVNLKNNGGRTALHYAASKGWLEVAEILISHGAKLNPKDKVGCTSLHRAASTGNSNLCELLIEEGAQVDSIDKAGQTPLMNAVICYNKEVALLLIRHGADVDVEDKEGFTVLGRATEDLRPLLIDAAKAMLEVNAGILSGFPGIESVPGPQLPEIEFLKRFNEDNQKKYAEFDERFKSSQVLKELLERSKLNKEKNKQEIQDKYCLRGAEWGVGDCSAEGMTAEEKDNFIAMLKQKTGAK